MKNNRFFNSFVLCSDEKSRNEGKVSLLAVAETILSVIGLWWLADFFNFYLLLITSIIIGFLVLLRSPSSIEMGQKMFTKYYATPISIQQVIIMLGLSFTIVGSFSWILATNWLIGHDGLGFFWRVFTIGFLAVNIAAAVAAAVAITNSATATVMATGAAILIGAVAVLVSVILSGAGAGAVVYVIIGMTAGAAGSLVTLPASYGAGIIVRAGFIRFWATLRHFFIGIPRFAKNWSHLALETDFFSPPELIPGLSVNHSLNFKNLVKTTPTETSYDTIQTVLLGFIIYTPSLIYRYYIKSTAWLYLPLVWLVHIPSTYRKARTGPLIWHSNQQRTHIEQFSICIAVLVLVYYVVGIFNLPMYENVKNTTQEMGLTLTYWHLIAGLDFSKIDRFYWLPFVNAICLIINFFWSNIIETRISNREKHNPPQMDYTPPQLEIWMLRKIESARKYLTVAWILIGIYSLTMTLHVLCELPSGVSDLLNWYIPQDRCA